MKILDRLNQIFADASGTREANLQRTVAGLMIWMVVSLLYIILYSLSSLSHEGWYVVGIGHALGVFGNAAMLGIAFTAVGGLFGFLFGIPRTIQTETQAGSDGSTGTEANAKRDAEYRQFVNTNMEQISDWLTKILVGVGLTQLQQIPHGVWNLAYNLKPGINDSQPVTTFIILNSLVCGFFFGYLLTRLFLAAAFSQADRDAAFINQANRLASELTEEGEYDSAASALEATFRKLDASTPKTYKRQLYEQLIFNYLYQDPPDGFTKAIQRASEYIQQEPGNASPLIWVYRACAYGQKYKWESENENRTSVLVEARNSALDSIKSALALDARQLKLIQMLWDPEDPTKIKGEDNDLEVFFQDEEFRKILGFTPKQ